MPETEIVAGLVRRGRVWAAVCALAATLGFLAATISPPFALRGWAASLLWAVALSSFVMVLISNARALAKQTGEDLAYVHLQTSLLVGLSFLVPYLGVFLPVAVAIKAIRGKLPRSGGSLTETPPPHLIGEISVHFGMLLIVISVLIQLMWSVFFSYAGFR